MIAGFQEWAASAQLVETGSLDQLEAAYIGIEAEYYIDSILTGVHTKEPLLPALGGIPFTVETVLEERLRILEDHKITPCFVFSGLSVNQQQKKLEASLRHSKVVSEAWDLYNASDPERAVAEFGTSCTFDVDHVYRHIQTYLYSKGVEFFVAPYSACAQLSHWEVVEHVDAVVGPPELLMFEVEKVITELDLVKNELSWVTRRTCIEALNVGSTSLFIDACLLAGSSFLSTLPQLEVPPPASAPSPPKIKAAAELIKSSGLNGNQLCLEGESDSPMKSQSYTDSYRRAVMSIKHNVVIRDDGIVEPLDIKSAPNDLHAILGQRLPDELLYYLSRGVVGFRVLSWRTTGEVVESPPLDGGDSITHKVLVRDQLVPFRLTALSLLSYSLNRFYQHKSVALRTWFNPDQEKTLSISDASDPKTAIADWNVRLNVISDKAKALKQNMSSLAFAVESLRDTDFASKTVTPNKNGYKPLTDGDEIKSNALWKYLQLRGYVSSKHTLTPLGGCLEAGFQSLQRSSSQSPEVQEAILLAVELLQLKLLNSDNMFPAPPYHGAPFRGTETDQRNTLLVSRIACLGRLKHKSIGYTGPLSRHLLAYHSIVSAVRSAQRDLVEMTLASMYLNAQADRHITNITATSHDLPFLRDVDCALGIAVKHYLDELSAQPEPTAEEARNNVKSKGSKTWFPHAVNFTESLAHAFELWDAVFAAVKVWPDSTISKSDKEEWARVDTWLAERR